MFPDFDTISTVLQFEALGQSLLLLGIL